MITYSKMLPFTSITTTSLIIKDAKIDASTVTTVYMIQILKTAPVNAVTVRPAMRKSLRAALAIQNASHAGMMTCAIIVITATRESGRNTVATILANHATIALIILMMIMIGMKSPSHARKNAKLVTGASTPTWIPNPQLNKIKEKITETRIPPLTKILKVKEKITETQIPPLTTILKATIPNF